MARPQKFTDHELRVCLADGLTGSEIATKFKVSTAFISKRVKSIEQGAASKAPSAVYKATNSVFDIRTALEENYRHCLTLLHTECENSSEKIRAIGEIRQHLSLSMSILETVYNAKETQMFMDEVMSVLDECAPGTRDLMLSRLAERRSVRSAFFSTEKP